MLEEGKSDEAIYTMTGKEFASAAFNEKRYLPWYKQNLSKLYAEGKRESKGSKFVPASKAPKGKKAPAKKAKKAPAKKTTEKKTAKKS